MLKKLVLAAAFTLCATPAFGSGWSDPALTLSASTLGPGLGITESLVPKTLNITARADGYNITAHSVWMSRKLPRQEDSSKVEFPAICWRASSGVRSPNESWGRSSLYSIIHQ